MTRIKLCGLMVKEDIACVNAIKPEYIGFVFYEKSRRFLLKEQAEGLKRELDHEIKAVGVFVDERPEVIAGYGEKGIIDLIQLHGHEDNAYIERLRKLTDLPVIQAFRLTPGRGTEAVMGSIADHVLLDSGAGTGKPFNWSVLKKIDRPYFLAGGLSPENVGDAVKCLKPFGVDVSSGIETGGKKDYDKMKAFTEAVRSGK